MTEFYNNSSVPIFTWDTVVDQFIFVLDYASPERQRDQYLIFETLMLMSRVPNITSDFFREYREAHAYHMPIWLRDRLDRLIACVAEREAEEEYKEDKHQQLQELSRLGQELATEAGEAAWRESYPVDLEQNDGDV